MAAEQNVSAIPEVVSQGAHAAGRPIGTRLHYATCSLDCPDSCRVIATEDVATGKLVKLTGDPRHPVTRGFLCGKVARYLDRVYSPERFVYPMRRRPGVPKGRLEAGHEADAFERISWNEALDTIVAKLQAISDRYGSESILPYSYAGTIGQLGYGSMDRRFFHRLGASQLDRTICASAGAAALMDVYGAKLGMEPQSFAKSKLIVAWGANIHGNNIHLWPFVETARRNGAKLVVIDPYETRTARLADQHLRIRPGTDVLLAMGLMHVIVRDDVQNDAYIARCTHGFAELRQRLMEPQYRPENVSRITGIDESSIVQLAHACATTKPVAIRVNYGVQRSESGGTAVRAIAMLPLLTGAWQQAGGGLLLSTSGAFPFHSAKLHMPELMRASPLGRVARTVNMSQLGHALTELGSDAADGPPVHALFVYNSNPAAVAPNQNAVLRGMARADLFTVVHDMFFTDTADYADILLPAPTWLEQKDVQGAYGHHHVQLSPAAIAPFGEAKSNVWLFGQLAQRMGFPESCFQDTEDELIDQVLSTEHPWLQGINRGALEKSLHGDFAEENGPATGAGFVALNVPRDSAGDYLPFSSPDWFRTPSGRGEFASETLRAQGLDPLPAYVAGEESFENASLSYPLQMLPRKADNFMNSTFANLPRHRAMEAKTLGLLEMHAEDAASRSLHDGDVAEVRSERGSLRLIVRVGQHVSRGVVAATLGWNKLSADGNGVNTLTSERLTDLAGGATFYSTLVEVKKVVSGPTPIQATYEDVPESLSAD